MTTETTWERDALKELLLDGLYLIEFTKRDGTLRRMLCTRIWGFIPESAQPDPQTYPVRKPNENTLPVWSLADNGWRSFRLDTIKSVNRVTKDAGLAEASFMLGEAGLPDTLFEVLEYFTTRN